MDGLIAAIAGLFAYSKYLEYESKSERAREERESAIEALSERAERLRDAVKDMEEELRYNPGAYSLKQLHKAEDKADRAEEALWMAQAGVHRNID